MTVSCHFDEIYPDFELLLPCSTEYIYAFYPKFGIPLSYLSIQILNDIRQLSHTEAAPIRLSCSTKYIYFLHPDFGILLPCSIKYVYVL